MPSAISDGGRRVERLQQKGARLRDDVSGFTAEVEGALGDFERMVREQLDQRPYATLAAASGFGYVLGGGVPLALTRVIMNMGGRFALVMLAQRLREGFQANAAPTEKE